MTRAICSLQHTVPDGIAVSESHPHENVLIEQFHRTDAEGQFWLDIHIDRKPYCELGPFEAAAERQTALAHLLGMMRSMGARDLPLYAQ